MKKHANKKITKRADKLLTKLACFLENDVKDNVFDIHLFWEEENGCGTTACACGWAAISPKFRGLVTGTSGSIHHKKSDTDDLEAARNYFNITEEQAEYLFSPSYYNRYRRGRKSVVNRIRKFVKDGCVKGSGGYTKFWLEDYAG